LKTPFRRFSWGRIGQVGKNRSDVVETFAVPLAQVSGDFDGIVEEIHSALESLRGSAFLTVN